MIRLATALAVIATAVMPAASANAIIGGTVDGAAHPFVAGIDARIPGSPISTASGVLVSPTVVVTAGHGTRRFDAAGITRARVTFDPVATDASTWYTGTIHTNPAYETQSADDPGDLGVIVLDRPVPGVTPASLPTAGELDGYGAPGLRQGALDAVGFGISRNVDGRPDFTSTGTRRRAPETFASLTPAWLRSRMNDGAQVCVGDSGSPTLMGDVAAGILTGESSLGGGRCVSEPWYTRLDTPQARAFLGRYVPLP